MTDSAAARPDEGMRKGAVEDDTQRPDGERRAQHGSLSGQLGHRDQDEMLKDADTDFITAAKEISAGVVMNVLPRMFLRLLVLLGHGGLPKESVPFGFVFVESSCAIIEQSSDAEPQQ